MEKEKVFVVMKACYVTYEDQTQHNGRCVDKIFKDGQKAKAYIDKECRAKAYRSAQNYEIIEEHWVKGDHVAITYIDSHDKTECEEYYSIETKEVEE